MTDRAARTAAAGSRGDLGMRLIDDFDDDLADGTIARLSGRPAGRHSFAPLLVLLVHTKQELLSLTGLRAR